MAVVKESAFSGPYFTNGAVTSFPFSFHAASEDELYVELNGVEVASELVSVSLADDGTGSVNIVPALPNGGTMFIRSRPNFRQESAFQRFGPFYPDRVNPPLDRAAIRDIYLNGRIEALTQIVGDGTPLPGDTIDDGLWNPADPIIDDGAWG
jgi:hypothetical protein